MKLNKKTQTDSTLYFIWQNRQWTLKRPGNLESFWDSIAEEQFQKDERLPYWVELWPSSFALASWLLKNRSIIKDKICLDIGCGLGFTSIVGAMAGAKVIGMDYEKEALLYAKRNATVNGINDLCWVAMDWRAPALLPQSCSYIWGGDIIYEKRFIQPVIAFLEYALAHDGKMWIAEPGRSIYESFNNALVNSGWSFKRIYQEKINDYACLGWPLGTTIVWEISK